MEDKNHPKINISNYDQHVLISVQPPDEVKRLDSDIVCVVDISGSMEEEAPVKNNQGLKETYGLSKLDVLKHAIRTTILSLGKNDRFGLVSFCDFAQIEYNLNEMTKIEQENAMEAVDKLWAEGKTNIWAGLQCGLNMLSQKYINGKRNASIILLTDGEPNISPKQGYKKSIENLLKKNPLKVSIQSFSFGKETNSQLLLEIARVINGDYSFIPCPGFIGTIFVNTLSNQLSTMGMDAELNIKTINGAKIEFNGQLVDQINLKVHDIKFGQTRDFTLKVAQIPLQQSFLQAQLKYYDFNDQKDIFIDAQPFQKQQFQDPMVLAHHCRWLLINNVPQVFSKKQNLQEQQKKIKDLSTQMHEIFDTLKGEDQDRLQKSKNFINGIIKDLDGEITLAFLKLEWLKQWGRHYIPSLINAHYKQICNNFIDHGLQSYGGSLYNQIKDYAEDIFIKLPPMKKSQRPEQDEQFQDQKLIVPQEIVQPEVQPVQMEYYYNCGGGGCFHGSCLVKMNDSSLKRVDSLVKGDRVYGDSQIIAVIKIDCNQIQLSKFENGLLITPNHPINIAQKWLKPYTLQKQIMNFNQISVYNFLLDKCHTLDINGVICSTLAHGFSGENIYHPYFGSQIIINDLIQIKGWKEGFITIKNDDFIRNNITKQIFGIRIQK